jgi:acyl carrier protein
MNTFERLKEVLKKVFEDDVDVSSINEDSLLIEDVGLNSIGMLYMSLAIEEEFGVQFQNDDFAKIRKVSDVIAKIEGND